MINTAVYTISNLVMLFVFFDGYYSESEFQSRSLIITYEDKDILKTILIIYAIMMFLLLGLDTNLVIFHFWLQKKHLTTYEYICSKNP